MESGVVMLGTSSRGWSALGVLAVGGLVGAVWFASSGGSSQDAVTGESAEVVDGNAGPALSSERARELERGINARDPERAGEVVVLGEQDPVAVAEEALPEGARLLIDEDTFEEVDGGGAVVAARIVGEQEFAVRLLLVEVEGRWLLSGSSAPEPAP